MKHDLKILVAASLGLASLTTGTAFAEDAAAPTGPTLGSVLEASGITATGYVAASYYHSDAQNDYHNYDASHDTFQLDQASLTIAYQPKEGFGALVDVIGGEDATLVAQTASPSKVAIAQGYVQYAGGPLTLMAGKYFTLAGAEVTAPTGNTNFSRSLLYYFEPAYHTGVRAAIAASDMFTVTVGVNNGWNYDKVSYGSKTGEIGVSFTPAKVFSLAAAGYFGKDPSYDAQKTLIDLVATINATDALSFVLSYDNGSQKFTDGSKAKWDGVAGYVNVAFNDMVRLSVRFEQFKDKDGFLTGFTDEKLKEATVTLGISPVKSFEVRAEVRQDKADDAVFRKVYDPTAEDYVYTDKQTEFALQGVYKF